MTAEMALVLALVAAAIVLFATEWVSTDVTALGVVAVLVVSGILEPEQAFAGFGSETVVTILGLLVLTAALIRTGVVDLAGRLVLRRTGSDPDRLLLVVMLASAGIGAFMSNTASTAFFLPVVMGIAGRAKVSPSKLLLPLAFAGILTSSVTLVSTSTNIVVSGLMRHAGLAPMGMFELAPVGIPIAVVGLLYMYFAARRMLPDKAEPASLAESFGISNYLSEVVLQDGSPLVGKTLREAGLGRELDLTVLHVVRGEDRYFAPMADLKLRAGDVLLVEGRRDDILKVKDIKGIDIKPDVKAAAHALEEGEVRLAEAVILPRSPLINTTLKRRRFRDRYGLQVLAINRHRETIHQKLSDAQLRMGDVLLIQGGAEALSALNDDDTFRVIGEVAEARPNVKRAPLAIGIFVASLAAATLKLVALPVAVLAGVVAAFATRCLTPEEAYREVEWKVLVLIGSMLSLGVAMTRSGTASYLATVIVDLTRGASPRWLLSGFFLLTVALTQPMSNQAAAVVVLPIAIAIAQQLGLNPRAFAMMVAVAASCSYLTPLEPACVMVYGPGRYRFSDFVRVGAPLTLLIFAISILLVPLVWPLQLP